MLSNRERALIVKGMGRWEGSTGPVGFALFMQHLHCERVHPPRVHVEHFSYKSNLHAFISSLLAIVDGSSAGEHSSLGGGGTRVLWLHTTASS